jgi:S-adenosylmethionine:tRNA ribosyltransferase-isomerase
VLLVYRVRVRYFKGMKTADFSFKLPVSLIAQYPSEQRGTSRLMTLDRRTRAVGHRRVSDLPELVESGALLVFNNSRVRKARLVGSAIPGGAAVEFLLLSKRGNNDGQTWQALVRRSKRRFNGSRYCFADGSEAEIIGEEGEYRVLRFDRIIDDGWLERYGHIPLPPYIKRGDTEVDSERYQTVYAKTIGSAAAPTAGLHFTGKLLSRLAEKHIESAFITLHVGLGTFLPVREENVEDHRLHEEVFTIDEEAAHRIENAKAHGRKIIAVGTTSVRTLEAASKNGRLTPGTNSTSIFIYPGYVFKMVDGLFTNFHTPQSSLLMLVSAFAGRDFIIESYHEAIQEGYRFFSYGDAMLIR